MTNRKSAGVAIAAVGIVFGVAACVQQVGQTISSSTYKPAASTPSKANASVLTSAHNGYRARHGAKALTWSDTLAGGAQAWADKCVFEHSRAAGVGENLIRWTGSKSDQEVVDLWYSENTGYDYASGGSRGGAVTGHFTQVVWQGTNEVGCGVAQCPSIGSFMVCNYLPAGNVFGRYTGNVSPPK